MDKAASKRHWRRLREHFEDYCAVLNEQTHPRHTSIYYNRLHLKLWWFYPNAEQTRIPQRRVWYLIAMTQADIFFITLVWAIPEALDDFVQLGQDLLWIIGTFYLVFKFHYFNFFADDVDDVIDGLDKMLGEAKNASTKAAIREEQRRIFLIESSLGVVWHVGIAVFTFLALTQPAWTSQPLPFHVIFPFQWHDPINHPVSHALIYIWQIVVVIYHMANILYIDLYSSHSFVQLATNLKILCMELKGLSTLCQGDDYKFRIEFGKLVAFHQRIIALVDRTNEVLVARRDPMVAARFICFMVLSFCHLSYWCMAGDLVTQQSQQVAFAAYDIYEWSPCIPEVQRDICFMMQRAQEPMCMAPSPFPAFNLLSNMAIVKQCYSILTLLLEYLD